MTQGAFGIILNSKKEILLCHRRDRDLWNLPGGQVELNESPWDTVIREIKEEICVESTIEELLFVNYKKSNDDFVFTFLCKIFDNQKLDLSDEVDEIGYFSLESIPENIGPKQKERIIHFFTNRKVQFWDQ